MRLPQSGIRIDEASWPLLQAHVAYWSVTSGAGNALGTTLVCADLDNFPTYVGNRVKLIGGGADGQDRLMMAQAVGGIITVDSAFTNAAGAAQQIPAGQLFVILSNPGGGTGGGGGMPPTAALWMFGIVSPTQAASTTIIDIAHLAGFQDDTFNDEFYMEILDAGGAAPEGEKRIITDYDGGTGRFTTDAFSANVEAGDIVAIFHKSIEAIDIIARGTLDTSSATVPADSTRTEGNDHFNGHLFVPTEGTYAGRATRIVDYTGVGGIFTLDPNNPLPGVSGAVDYIVIKSQTEFVPAVDGANNRTPSDVIGSKASTAVYAKDAVSDVIRYLKGLMDAQITAWGTADVGSGAGLVRDAARTEVNDWWNGQTILMLTGAAAFQKRPITDFLAATDDIIIAPNFDAAVGAGDVYVILAHYNMIVPRTADDVANALTSQVIGRKDDTAIAAADNVSSIIRYLKGIIAAVGGGSLDGKPNVQEVIIYPIAEDAGVTELAQDGTDPPWYPAAAHSTAVVGEGNAVAAWSEDIPFEAEGTITIISLYIEMEWQSRFLIGAGNGTNTVSKIQISRDGGATFVDVTDNYQHNNAVMTGRIRAGVGLWIPTIVAGANQLVIRLVHWVDAGTGVSTSEAQIRSNSYIRLTYRKS